jgi:hypothetical protein
VRRKGRQESSSSFTEKWCWSMGVCGEKGEHGPHKDRLLVTTGGGRLLSLRRRNRGSDYLLRIRPSSLFILLRWSSNSIASLRFISHFKWLSYIVLLTMLPVVGACATTLSVATGPADCCS